MIPPDQIGTIGNTLKFAWSCSRRSGHGCNILYGINAYASPDGSTLNFPANFFMDITESYLFSVNVYYRGSSAMKTVEVKFIEANVPSVDIELPTARKINPTKKFILHGIVKYHSNNEEQYSIQWQETSGYLNEQKEIQPVYGSPQDRMSLVILPNSLLPGRSYTFRLTVSNSRGASYAEITISNNKPPSSGYIETYPKIATSDTTEFTTYTNSWADDRRFTIYISLFFFLDLENNDTIIPISTEPGFSSEIKHSLPYLKGVKYYKNYCDCC